MTNKEIIDKLNGIIEHSLSSDDYYVHLLDLIEELQDAD